MKCYNHHDRDAFGVCPACGKALCLECMDESSDRKTCKDNKNCKEFISFYANQVKAVKMSMKTLHLLGIILIIIAISLFFVVCVFHIYNELPLAISGVILGTFFILYSKKVLNKKGS